MFINSDVTFRNNGLKWFSIVWAIVVIAPLVYFPGVSSLTGHPWKVELIISLILGLFLTHYYLIQQKNTRSVAFSSQLLLYIIAPIIALVIWSAVSVFWAGSIPSVIHHTLVWACYLTFFLFALYIAANKKFLKASLISLGAVATIISLCCIAEFTSNETVSSVFRVRYSKFAEIFATLLPLFFSLVLRLKRKYLVCSVLVTTFIWLGVLFSLSRAALLSSVTGLLFFVILRALSKKDSIEKRRLVFASLGIIFIVLFTQIPGAFKINEQKESALSRIAMRNEYASENSASLKARIFFAGVTKEMFLDNSLSGVGANNFGLEFNKYRAVFSAKPENTSTAEIQGEYLPERAHNEYLQILAELGIVGGMFFLWLLFGIAKLGFAEIIKKRFERSNILTHAAIGGITAFLVSSMFSSYSFRLMQNGLVFFFLLAILLRNFMIEENWENQNNLLVTPKLKLAFTLIALTVCLSLTLFSGLKAASQYLVYQAETQESFEEAKSYYQNAILLDPANASAHFSFGLRLLGEGRYEESASQFQLATKKGINDSVSYSYVISAQTLASQPLQTINTASEAVKIYPFSVFLRVRYAALLNKYNKTIESERELKIAEQLNAKQAKTWWLLINNGSLKTSQEARINKEISILDELIPNSAIYAILAEREILYPNEKPKFNFHSN